MAQTLEQNKTFIRNQFEEFMNRKNSALEIVQFGRSLARIYPELSLGNRIEQHFQLDRPILNPPSAP